MNSAAPAVPRARVAVTVTVALLALAVATGPLCGRLLAGDPIAPPLLGAVAAAALVAGASLRRLDLLLLLANVAAIAFLPAIHHRSALAAAEPNPFYDGTLLRIALPELLAAAALAAAWLRRRTAPAAAAAPAGGALPALVAGFLALGLLVGLVRGNSLAECLRDGRKFAYVALAHLLVVHCAGDAGRRRALLRCVALALAARALVTLAAAVADRGFHYHGFLRSSVDVGDFLGFLALIYLPAAQLRARPTQTGERLLLGLLIVIGSAATLATFSRAAWCAAPIGIAVLLLHRVRESRAAPRALAAAALLAAVAAPLLVGGLAGRAVDRLEPLLDPAGDTSVSYRLRELRGAAGVVADHPLVGIGLGTRFDAGAALVDRRRAAPTMVHNLYLWSAVKAGAAGLLLMAAVLGIPALQLSRAARRGGDPATVALALGLLALLAAFAALGLVGAMVNQARVAIALGLVTGLAQTLAAPSAAASPPPEPRR